MRHPALRCTLGCVPVRVLIALLWVVPWCAAAHTTKLSSAEIALAGREADVVRTLNGADLEAAPALKLTTPDGAVARERLQAARTVILDYVVAHARISNSAGPLPTPCSPG